MLPVVYMSEKVMKKQFKNIELLRIIGCLSVILIHLFKTIQNIQPDYELFNTLKEITSHGYLSVELFFILSGFFFAFNLDTTKSLFEFLKKKIIRLYPVLIIMLIIGWLVHALFGLYKFSIYHSILILFGLNGTALYTVKAGTGNIVGTGGNTFWYVSAMLWTFALFYYLLKNYERKTANLIIALLIFTSYSLLSPIERWEIREHITLFFNHGICRAFGGIGIGYFIAQWYNSHKETIQNYTLSTFQKLFITLIEFMCLFFIINNLFFHKIKYNNNIIFVLVFTLIVFLFIYNKGFISECLNKDIFSKLSKYTYSIYLSHHYLILLISTCFWKTHQHFLITHPILNIGLFLSIAISFGVILYHFVEKPAIEYFKKKAQ